MAGYIPSASPSRTRSPIPVSSNPAAQSVSFLTVTKKKPQTHRAIQPNSKATEASFNLTQAAKTHRPLERLTDNSSYLVFQLHRLIANRKIRFISDKRASAGLHKQLQQHSWGTEDPPSFAILGQGPSLWHCTLTLCQQSSASRSSNIFPKAAPGYLRDQLSPAAYINSDLLMPLIYTCQTNEAKQINISWKTGAWALIRCALIYNSWRLFHLLPIAVLTLFWGFGL